METSDREELSRMFYELLVANGILFQYNEKFNLKKTVETTHESTWGSALYQLDCGKSSSVLTMINLKWHRKVDAYYLKKQQKEMEDGYNKTL